VTAFPCKCIPLSEYAKLQITIWNILDKQSYVGQFVINTTCHVASGTHCSLLHLFLDAFAKLRTTSSWLFVRPHGKTRLPLDVFSCNLIYEHFTKICRENLIFIKIEQNKRAFSTKTNKYFSSYIAHSFLNGKCRGHDLYMTHDAHGDSIYTQFNYTRRILSEFYYYLFTFISNTANYIVVILDNSLVFRVTIPEAVLTL
jgi:hypothetical protein